MAKLLVSAARLIRGALLACLLGTSIAAMAQETHIAADAAPLVEYAIALHGGAGPDPAKITPQRQRAIEAAMESALRLGQGILAEGGSALDAVEQTIRQLEDDPLFNAGRGAVFNAQGRHELDASIMDGRTKGAGAVAGVRTVRNPISLARLVMSETRHVLLIGDGAEQFADEMRDRRQIARVENEWYSTEEKHAEWQRALAREAMPPGGADDEGDGKMGTVGCVALDKHGNLAAGTSTGGLTNKRWGRVGDSPVIGAGTYADNAVCGVSCTGVGEEFIRHAIAFHIAALVKYKGLALEAAVQHAIDDLLQKNMGGLIAVGRDGTIVMRTNTPGMARAAADSRGRFEVALPREAAGAK